MKLSFCSNNSFKSLQMKYCVLLLSAKVRQSSTFSGLFPLREGNVLFGARVLVCSACARGEPGVCFIVLLTYDRHKKQLYALIGLLFLDESETLGLLSRAISGISPQVSR